MYACSSAGVAAEQRVRQRAVAPEEAGQVEPHEQADEGVEQAVAEVRDRQPAPRQQRAVRQRVVEVAGDQQAVAVAGALGDDGDDDRPSAGGPRRAPRSRRYSRWARWSGSSLTTYDVRWRAVAELDEPHDVAVQAEHAVHVRQVPVVEVGRRTAAPRGAGGPTDRRTAAAPPFWPPVTASRAAQGSARLDLVPQGVERGQVGGAQVDAALGGERLDAPRSGGGTCAAAARTASSASTSMWRATLTSGDGDVAELVGDARRRRRRRSPRAARPTSSSTLASGPSTSGQSKPTLAALRIRCWA